MAQTNDSQEQVTINVETLQPVTRTLMTIGALPTSYLISMTYEEQLLWLQNYLIKTVIPAINNNAEATQEVQDIVMALQDYINDYFNNLDVQEEINNKLDDLVADGTLTRLIGDYVQPLIDEQNQEIANFKTSVNGQIATQNAQIQAVTSGSPLVASSVSEMTDTTRVYVNTTDGKWYYYNGTQWVAGGVYQSTGIDENDPVILNINTKFNDYLLSTTQTINLPFLIHSGETIKIDVQSLTGSATIYIKDHSSHYVSIQNVGKYTFTAQNDGVLKVYMIGNSPSIVARIKIETDLLKEIENNSLYNYSSIYQAPNFNNFQLKDNRILNNFPETINSFNFQPNATIETYQNYATSSNICHVTPPIRIKNNDGSSLYNINLNGNISSNQLANGAYTFDRSGKYLRHVTFYALSQREKIFLDDEYYAILTEYPTTATYTNIYWSISNVSIPWLTNKTSYVVDKNGNGDFLTFTEMLSALQNDTTEKTIYVNEGEYDIFEEIGGSEYINSIAETASSLNWRDVNYVVPENTHIIGKGKVTLKFTPTENEIQNDTIAKLFSPLNISGNCIIENINVIGQNCRYTVHDETSNMLKFSGSTHKYINCHFNYLSSTYGNKVCYGAGHSENMLIDFENCIIESAYVVLWSTHDWNETENQISRFIFNNCIFKSVESYLYIQFVSTDTVGRIDEVSFNNCYFKHGVIRYETSSQASVRQGYKVKLIGCNQVYTSYHQNVTVQYDTEQYNTIS